jgi:hypothetical protein
MVKHREGSGQIEHVGGLGSRALFPLAAASVVIPCWTYFIPRLLLLCMALNRTLRGRPSPYEGDVMETSPGWPPFIAPSFPFWLSLPLLLVLAVLAVARPSVLVGAFKPGFIAAYLVLSATWALLFAASFSGTSAWHRDSAVPGVVLLGAGAAVGVSTAWRSFRRGLRRVRKSSRGCIPAREAKYHEASQ